jgi:polyhydroxybutyrate depolymerase
VLSDAEGTRPKSAAALLGFALLALLAGACGQAGSGTGSTTTRPMASGSAAAADSKPSAGCRTPAGQRELTLARQNLLADGQKRWYLISTPPPALQKQPMAVVMDFHGLGEGAQLEALTSQFGPLAQKDGFVAVFPQGTGTPVHWDTASAVDNPDLDFVSEMLDKIESALCVDESRIYATGLSDGAFMTSFLACTMSDRIAAFAPVSGVQLASNCAATRPVPILAFHGTADPILYFNGGVGSAVLSHALDGGPPSTAKIPAANLNGPGYPATVASWAKRDGCGSEPTNTRIAPRVIERVYPCPAKTAVEFYIILGGGHAWPGSKFSESIAAITGPTTFEVNATTVIWDFFKRFQL